VALRPNAGHGLLVLEVSRSHTTTHHSRYDSSGRVIGSSQRPLPDSTQHSQQTNIHTPGGIRTHDLSRRAAADLRLRPRGHWDRLYVYIRISSNNDRHPDTKTFTTLHYICRHFTSSHLNFTQLHFTTLSFCLNPFKFPTAPFHLTSLHFTSLHLTSLHCILDDFRHTSVPFASSLL
jgi:hypothetical protein